MSKEDHGTRGELLLTVNGKLICCKIDIDDICISKNIFAIEVGPQYFL